MDPLAQPELLIRRVYAYVAYRIGDGPDAEDVTSETFARAVRYRDTFDASKGDSLTWLIGISRRCIAAHLGAKDAPVEHSASEAPGDLVEGVMRRLDLSAALAGLSARDRELVALRYGADLTARQIGELLELQTNAVEVALHRALQRLRLELEPGTPAVKAAGPSASASAVPTE